MTSCRSDDRVRSFAKRCSMRQMNAMTPRTMIVVTWRPWVTQMAIPSTTAIQMTMRSRWRWNQLFGWSGVPSITCEPSLTTASTVPGWCRHPGPAELAERAPRGIGVAQVVEETVQRRSGTRDVRAEGTCPAKLLRER